MRPRRRPVSWSVGLVAALVVAALGAVAGADDAPERTPEQFARWFLQDVPKSVGSGCVQPQVFQARAGDALEAAMFVEGPESLGVRRAVDEIAERIMRASESAQLHVLMTTAQVASYYAATRDLDLALSWLHLTRDGVLAARAELGDDLPTEAAMRSKEWLEENCLTLNLALSCAAGARGLDFPIRRILEHEDLDETMRDAVVRIRDEMAPVAEEMWRVVEAFGRVVQDDDEATREPVVPPDGGGSR